MHGIRPEMAQCTSRLCCRGLLLKTLECNLRYCKGLQLSVLISAMPSQYLTILQDASGQVVCHHPPPHMLVSALAFSLARDANQAFRLVSPCTLLSSCSDILLPKAHPDVKLYSTTPSTAPSEHRLESDSASPFVSEHCCRWAGLMPGLL